MSKKIRLTMEKSSYNRRWRNGRGVASLSATSNNPAVSELNAFAKLALRESK